MSVHARHVARHAPDWSRLFHRFKRLDRPTLCERYMQDEEREDYARHCRRDPIKAEREEAFRAGLTNDWRTREPGRPSSMRRRWIMFRAVHRERRDFRRARRAHGRTGRLAAAIHRFAAALDRFAELGHKIMESPWVLTPLGLMCLWAILHAAGVFK